MIKLAIIDDNFDLLEQFKNYFSANEFIALVATATSVEEFQMLSLQPSYVDILLLDITLPGCSGTEALPYFKGAFPDTDIIMFTIHEEDEHLATSICNGAVGYLLKDSSLDLVEDYIKMVKKGGSAISAKLATKLINLIYKKVVLANSLTAKEYEVLRLLSEGWSYKLIADKACLSEDGVRFYIKRIYRALNVNSKGEAIRKFYLGA